MLTHPLAAGSEKVLKRLRAGLEMYESGACTAAQLAKGLRQIADALDPPKEKRESEETKRKVEQVFAAWRAEMLKTAATKLTPERRAKVEARLREGYSVDEIIVAIKNCASSEFHHGANERGQTYDDLTLICRTGSKLEQFRDMGPHQVETGTRSLLPSDRMGSRATSSYKERGW